MTTGREDRSRALETAAEWLLRLHADEIDDGVVEAWSEWMLADPDNARAFDDLSLLWDAASDVDPHALPAVGSPGAPETAAGPTAQQTARRGWRAAQPRRGRRRLLASLAGLAAVFGVTALGAWWWMGAGTGGTAHVESVATGIGEHRRVSLPDGSAIDLGAASRVEVRYSAARREVELVSGVARFTVARAPERPFEVRAGGALAQALGTRFSVALRHSAAVEVAVAEGLVRFGAGDPAAGAAVPVQLMAGRGGVWRPDGTLEGPDPVAPGAEAAWLAGQIVYRGATVEDVLGDLNRYSVQPVVLMADATGFQPVTGRWLTHDVDGWLEGLAAALSLDVVRERGRILLVPARPRGRT